LRNFDLIAPELTSTQDTVNGLLAGLREPDAKGAPDLRKLAATAAQHLNGVLAMVAGDIEQLKKALPRRKGDLGRLAQRPEVHTGAVDRSAISVAELDRRVAAITEDFDQQRAQMRKILALLDRFASTGRRGPLPAATPTADHHEAASEKPPAESAEAWLLAALDRLATQLNELALTQAQARLETATLLPITLEPAQALRIAGENRLDWMNARAALVDSWRQVEVAANGLRGDLKVSLSGDVSTVGNNPTNFSSTAGHLQAGVQFDAPLSRLAERNVYREALIDYQRARRAFYSFEDRINQNLRDTLRQTRTAQLDFELRRAGVNVAIRQVELAQLKLETPAKPGDAVRPLDSNAARDLVGALAGLLQAQNDFVGQWIDYETQRLNLDLELGTMQLDSRGQWIDPGAIESSPPGQPSQLRTVAETSVAFRSAKERNFRGAKGDSATVVDSPVLSQPGQSNQKDEHPDASQPPESIPAAPLPAEPKKA
jgi:hypothetical protein